MTRWKFALLAVVAVAALSGCMRFSADLTVSQDDTVSGTFVVAVKEGTGDSYGVSDKDLATDIWADYPRSSTLADARIGSYAKDGYRGITITFADEPLSSFAPTEDEWGIERQGDEFVVSGPVSSTSASDTGTEGGPLAAGSDGLAEAEFTVALTFPGKVSQSNGTVVGRSVTWELKDGLDHLEARASAVPTRDPAVLASYVVAAVLAAGALAYWFAGRPARRSR